MTEFNINGRRVFTASEIINLYRDDNRSLTEKYGQFGAPYFMIEISDKSEAVMFSQEAVLQEGGFDLNGLLIGHVEFEESIDEADMIVFTVNDPTLELINHRMISEGNNVDIWMGYDGRAPFYMGRGIIVEISPDLAMDSIPTIKVTCYDISYFMMEEGRAEIVPEGTAWWEQRRAPAVSHQPRVIRYTDAHPDQPLTADEQAENSVMNLVAAFQNPDDPVLMRDQPFGESMDAGEEPDLHTVNMGEVEVDATPEEIAAMMQRVSSGEMSEEQAAAALALGREEQGESTPASQLTWRRQSNPRRRRRNGHVWRGMGDSQIVEAIFLSYGIVPFVEATQRFRRSTATRSRVRQETPIASEAAGGSDRLQRRINELSDADIARIEAEQAPDESMEETRDRLFREEEYSDAGVDYAATDGTDLDDANELQHSSDTEAEYRYFDRDDRRAFRFHDEDDVFSGTPRSDGWRWRNGEYEFTDDRRFRPIVEPDDTPPTQEESGRSTTERTVTQQSGTTDWDFIKKLAEKHGYLVFVFFHYESRKWIGYWGPEENVPQYREFIFRYNAGDDSSLASVRPSISLRNQSTEVDLIYVDPVTRRENTLRLAMDNISEYTGDLRGPNGPATMSSPVGEGPEVTLIVHGQRVRTHADRRFRNVEEAREWLMAYWVTNAKDFHVIEGDTVIGIPELRGRQYHRFLGMERFSGRFFVSQVRHEMSTGSAYKTSFSGYKAFSHSSDEDPGSDLLVVDQNEIGQGEALYRDETISLQPDERRL